MNEDSLEVLPRWVQKIIYLVHKNWNYHAPCLNINSRASFDKVQKVWQIEAAPVYQEVFGGNEDGKKVWAGFIFDIGDFSKENGVWVQEFAVASYCNECNEHPKLMIKGKYKGHRFLLNVFLEPVPTTKIAEIIDVIRHEIRNLPEEGESDE
jgi:hypothetical protein